MTSRSTCALALLLTLALPASAFAADKPTLIEKLIPQDLKDIGKQAGELIGVYTGISGVADTVESLVAALGIIHPDSGPDIEQLFEDLTEHLDSIAGSLDWKIDATARAERFGKMMSAVEGVMTAMALEDPNNPTLPSALKANANSNSTAVINEIKASSGVSFLRLSRDSVTSGNWKNFIPDRPQVQNGLVYDWRLGIPELLQFVALRQQVMTAVDPNWKQSGTFKTEMLSHRAFIKSHYDKMSAGVKCRSIDQSDCSLPNAESCLDTAVTTITCADIHTGSWNQSTFAIFDPENQKVDRISRQVKRKMPLFEMRSMMDTLFAYANPTYESLTSAGSIMSMGGTSLCLDVKGGDSTAGTPVQLWSCNYTAAQTWTYDRQSGEIYNPAFGKCLDVRGGSVKSGTQVQIWSCNGTDSQRWTWDPEKLVLENGLGTVLDVQWGTFAKGTPVWTWTRNESATAQHWVLPSIFDAIVRCSKAGTC